MSIPRRIRRRVPNVVPIGAAVWQLSQTFECVTPPPPQMPLGYCIGELYLAYVHSQTNPPTCTKFGANRCSRLTASQDFWMCDPPPPQCPLGIEGWLGFSLYPFPDESADVNQSWCQSVQPFDSFPDVWMLTPKTPSCLEGQFVWRISIPRWICRCVPNLVPIGPAVWQLPQTFEFVTPYPPPQMPLHGVLRGDLYLAYVHSQMNPQTWTKVGANRTASQDFWIVDPLKPTK